MSDEEEQATTELIKALDGLGYEGLTEPGKEERAHAIAKLMTTKWSELEAIEHADYLLFPEVLTRRRKDGSWEEKPIMMRVAREHELRQARVKARQLAVKEGIDEERDQTSFNNLENMVILSMCIRNNTSPYEPWEPDPLLLERKYDRVCIHQLWDKLERLNDVLNPAPNNLSGPEIVALMISIAEARHLGPLVVYGPGAQTSFVVSMADLLLKSLTSKLSSESLEHLMRVSSTPTDSSN